MTGQVKEDILSRFFELGVRVGEGAIHIEPVMLRADMFRDGVLHFTYCQTPFVYRLGSEPSILVEFADGKTASFSDALDASVSHHIFARDGQVKQVTVTIKL